eukprot:XP_001706243.1 Hypothetical protein GL50803_119493 [Giardia lamblia ATCC 50803]
MSAPPCGHSTVASMRDCHSRDPGSIPGDRGFAWCRRRRLHRVFGTEAGCSRLTRSRHFFLVYKRVNR